MERTADIRFRFRTASQSSSVRSLKEAKAWTPPALFTSTWIVPKRFTTRNTWLVGSVARLAIRIRAIAVSLILKALPETIVRCHLDV